MTPERFARALDIENIYEKFTMPTYEKEKGQTMTN